MKKFAVIFAVLFLAFAINASAVNDNSTSDKSGTGNFKCTVILPISIDDPADVNLGEFVKSGTQYDINATMVFTVTGEQDHSFYYKITEDEDEATGAHLDIDWDHTVGASTLDETGLTGIGGTHTITATADTFDTGTLTGPKTFAQIVEVGYSSL